MGKTSAGILAWRKVRGAVEVLLVHPGGPFFIKKDEGAWSIPKGEYDATEEPLIAAQREFVEELGTKVNGEFIALEPVKQKSGKTVFAWAVEADPDIANFKSNTFVMEWPPRSGKMQEFPEVDKAEWFVMDVAKTKVNPAQVALLEELGTVLMA